MEETYERIKPEDVVAAYQKRDLFPVQDSWGYRNFKLGKPEEHCACGMTAYAIHTADSDFNEWMTNFNKSGRGMIDYVASHLNLPTSYVSGFVSGFDKRGDETERDEDYRKGHEDGKKAYKHVKQSGIFNKYKEAKP